MYANQFIFSRERRRFGRQCAFRDHNELMVSVHPSGRLRLKYILRNPTNRATQLSHQFALSTMKTENVTLDMHGMNHYEGGWPKEININDEEQTQRHRKKVERDDSWGEQVNQLIRDVRTIAEQNNAINIYEEFFPKLPHHMGDNIRNTYTAHPINIFRDLWLPSRELRYVEWVPNDFNSFMVLYANQYRGTPTYDTMTSEETEIGSQDGFFIWDIKNSLRPRFFPDCFEMTTRAKVCPRDENNMAGGTMTGKVCTWQTYKGGMPTRVCPLETAHRERTSAVVWVHSKSNTEFYSGSLDGSIKYWDMRDLNMTVHELLLEPNAQVKQDRQASHGVTVLEFEYTIPVRFIIGSDMGCIFVGNRKGMTPPEILVGHYPLFSGPIRTIMRNPFFVKNFLVTGDWRARIWSEEAKDGPSTMYVKKKYQIRCGAWSTGRCSLFVTGDDNGELSFWDLLLDQRVPVHTIGFKSPITDVQFRQDGKLLAVTLKSGDCFLLRVDPAMTSATGKERALIANMFEREILRSKLLEARVEELKLKRRTKMLEEEAEKKKADEEETNELIELDPDNADQFVAMIEGDEEFREAIADFQNALLAIERKRSKRKVIMERTDFEE